MSGYTPVELVFDVFEPKDGANPDLAPVIFHHGLTASKAYWIDIPQNVADRTGRKVYSVDARNHGDSDWTDEFSFELVGQDLEHFFETHNIKKAVLVGHSMGGVASMKVALRRPELVEKLIVEDMVARRLNPEEVGMVLKHVEMLQESIKTVPDGADENAARVHLFKQILAHMEKLPIPLAKPKPEVMNTLLAMKKGPDGRFVLKANLKALLEGATKYSTESKENEGTYLGEAFFIYGTLSPFNVLIDERIPQHFPKATFYAVQDATHMVHGEEPEEFTDEIVKFILQ